MRQLTEILHAKEAGAIYSLLLSLHVEGYIKETEETSENYRFAAAAEELAEHVVYVPEADYEACADALREAGYASLICTRAAAPIETENERILREFQQKRKWHMIEWAIVIAAVILFQIVRSLL